MHRLVPFLAIVFAIAIFFVYVKPTYSGPIAVTRAQIASYDDALAAAKRFQQKEAQLSQQRAQIPASSLDRLAEFLPDGVDNVQLILDLDALAARSGVTLSDFNTVGTVNTSSNPASSNSTPASTQPIGSSIPTLGQGRGLGPNSAVQSLSLTFNAAGTYSSFRGFLSGVENSLRPLDITDVKITQSDTGVYQYAMTVRIYWLQ